MALELDDIQGLVLGAYPKLPWARYLILRIDDPGAARAWLGTLAGDVATAETSRPPRACNVAVSFAGLARLGLPPDALATFPWALRQGMVTEYRSRLLGDRGPSAPQHWCWGAPGAEADVLLASYAATAGELLDRSALDGCGVSEMATVDSLLLPYSLEHFGFTDGVSQPILAGTPRAARTSAHRWEVVEQGEFVLGYPDESGLRAEGPTVGADRSSPLLPTVPGDAGRRDLGRNGSYLVVRQLAQDVVGFRRYVDGNERLAAEMVGRWPNGAPLALAPDQPVEAFSSANDFGYEHDKHGLRCPLGAHIRRANPRNSTSKSDAKAEEIARRSANRHRILRRGRPYGSTDLDVDEERGLFFVALNADIERQFEFVQHTWLNNPTFAGLCGEVDPLTGDQPDGGGTFTQPELPVRRRHRGLPNFVTTRGGGYFFLPGLRALRWIGSL
ncbi:MAG: Dyp-type peroxidase [Actinobacteria bacterium]|nr:Dyp-type peroxidase [Actinomycetota bacterium]